MYVMYETLIQNVGENKLTFAKAAYCDRLPSFPRTRSRLVIAFEFFDPNVNRVLL